MNITHMYGHKKINLLLVTERNVANITTKNVEEYLPALTR